MTQYVGGLRARLIQDSVYNMVHDCLEDLGWFDSGRQHQPVTMIPEALENDTEIKPNIIALDDDNINSIDSEMGSNLAEHQWDMVFDIYAEDNAVGKAIALDIRDILQGRFTSLGRVAPVVTVYDYTMATPSPIFKCDLENVSYDRVRSATKTWQKFWFVVFFTVVDEYGNDSDDELYI